MILGKRPDIERFLSRPEAGVRAALIYGRDMGVVRERGQELAARIAKDPNDPFDVAQLTDGDLDGDSDGLDRDWDGHHRGDLHVDGLRRHDDGHAELRDVRARVRERAPPGLAPAAAACIAALNGRRCGAPQGSTGTAGPKTPPPGS